MRCWLSEQDKPSQHLYLSASPTVQAHITAMATASSSTTAIPTAAPGNSRKHGLSRFSLRRLFRSVSFARRGTGRLRPTPAEMDSRSEGSMLGLGEGMERKDSSSFKEAFRLRTTGPSTSDSESNSLSSGHMDSCHPSVKGLSTGQLECPLCLLELPLECFPELTTCSHRACFDCLQQYLKIEISESRVNISCPECTEPIHPNDIRMILNDEIFLSKYECFMLRRVLVTEPDARWCPAPDCGYVVIASGCASCPKLKCERPGCDTYFCYHCKQEWHPNQTCDAARAQRARQSSNLRSASVTFSQDSIAQRDDIKSCPCCKVLIIKMDDGSCNHMTCSVCGTEFCWLCMKEISDLHYLSPSGCTFWGKKPWSRKKKIMWQLGMLVGAPVGIALIAGIAVPAIIIGIPVWVGRKLHAKYEHQASKHKRNLIVTGGVVASMLVSPILAGIAVGIGVPILLAYVYGVVPISLCRSGGCGVTTSASGVRIEFDEENDIGIGSSVAADGVSVDTAASHRGANASIGEVSFGMSTSLSMGSGSHLERVGLVRDRDSDRESASNTALAGSIASASLAGGPTHKLEVQADVASNKRFSLSSHSETASATVSLSERSANMSIADDASTRALAGSLLGYRESTSSAVTPVEVHVDAQMTPDEVAAASTALAKLAAKFQPGTGMVEECAVNMVGSKLEDASAPQTVHYYCSDEETSYAVETISRSGSPNWQKLPTWQPVGGGTPNDYVFLHSRTDEPKKSSADHGQLHDFKDCCVSFIDETPVTGSGTEGCTSMPSDLPSRHATAMHANNTGLTNSNKDCRPHQLGASPESVDNFGSILDTISYHQPLPKDSGLRRIIRYESKSVDQLAMYCDLCQKIHRPCCPNAYVHQVIGPINKVPVRDSNETVVAVGHCLCQVAMQCELPPHDTYVYPDGGADHLGNCREDFMAPDSPVGGMTSSYGSNFARQAQSCISMCELEKVPSRGFYGIADNCLPYVEEPERSLQRKERTRPRSAPYSLGQKNVGID